MAIEDKATAAKVTVQAPVAEEYKIDRVAAIGHLNNPLEEGDRARIGPAVEVPAGPAEEVPADPAEVQPPDHPPGRPGAETKSATVRLHRDLLLRVVEGLAEAEAVTTPAPAVVEAVTAWAAADTVAEEEEDSVAEGAVEVAAAVEAAVAEEDDEGDQPKEQQPNETHFNDFLKKTDHVVRGR
jgi:hypothetical protein